MQGLYFLSKLGFNHKCRRIFNTFALYVDELLFFKFPLLFILNRVLSDYSACSTDKVTLYRYLYHYYFSLLFFYCTPSIVMHVSFTVVALNALLYALFVAKRNHFVGQRQRERLPHL